MNADRWLDDHSFNLDAEGVNEARTLLDKLTSNERAQPGSGDIGLMRLLCVQLFVVGDPRDAIAIAAARASSFDARVDRDRDALRRWRGRDYRLACYAAYRSCIGGTVTDPRGTGRRRSGRFLGAVGASLTPPLLP
jgi:hypothetical protein